jgi:hypothetical protein
MNNEAVATVLSSGLSLLGLAVLYLWLYRDYRRDLLRTRLFTLRAELFDGAADGRIDFNHPAYGLLRGMLHGFLRSGHDMGAFRLLLTAMFINGKELESLYGFRTPWREATRSLDPEVREWLERIRSEAHEAFFRHLLATTGFAYLLIVAWIAIWEARSNGSNRKRRPVVRGTGGPVPKPPSSFNFRLDSAALASAGGV